MNQNKIYNLFYFQSNVDTDQLIPTPPGSPSQVYTDRQIDVYIARQIDGYIVRQIDGYTDRQVDGYIVRYIDGYIVRYIDGYISRQIYYTHLMIGSKESKIFYYEIK